jgi:carbonic anhydrase
MNRIIVLVLLNVLLISNAYAADWTKLHETKHATLMLDKQSITSAGKFQKAWVKINYTNVQTNLEYVEKNYNNAKLLWYFNCAEQKSATAQVYQLLNDEQVFSAAIDIKRARFLEPVPETEIDIAMHYVCKQKAETETKEKLAAAKKSSENNEKALDKPDQVVEKSDQVVEKSVATPEKKEVSETISKVDVAPLPADGAAETGAEKSKVAEKNGKANAKEVKSLEDAVLDDTENKDVSSKEKKPKVLNWQYKGSNGPEFWGDLSPEFVSCKVGRNQSPIDINKTTITTPKPLKTFQRFPATDISNNGYTVLANFKSGNFMVVDSIMYQMTQVRFHTPSENTIMGKSFPLEAQFEHVDPEGNIAILVVMFEEGPENKAVAKLWKQMPKTKGQTKALQANLLAGELMPRKKEYYRYSGSLTTPPCSEGVIWVVMKSTMTASASQIEAFKKVMRHDNNRPVQPLNGRIVIE